MRWCHDQDNPPGLDVPEHLGKPEVLGRHDHSQPFFIIGLIGIHLFRFRRTGHTGREASPPPAGDGGRAVRSVRAAPPGTALARGAHEGCDRLFGPAGQGCDRRTVTPPNRVCHHGNPVSRAAFHPAAVTEPGLTSPALGRGFRRGFGLAGLTGVPAGGPAETGRGRRRRCRSKARQQGIRQRSQT